MTANRQIRRVPKEVKMSKLSDRKKRVLEALVDSYIANPEPISSGAIQKTYLPDVSPATIRSELATLEELGYLVQPHVSSGRIPSTKAYRYYVDAILENFDGEIDEVKKQVDNKLEGIEEIVKKTARLVSDLTNYTSLCVISDINCVIIKEIKLIDLRDGTALTIIYTDSGALKDKLIALPQGADESYLNVAGKMLNDAFAGKTVSEIQISDNDIAESMKEYKSLFDAVLTMLEEYRKNKSEKVIVEGAEKICDYPEYQNVDNMQNFLSVIKTDNVEKLLTEDRDIEFSIKIGKEECEGIEKNMALVTAKYKIGGHEVGQLGVIGPERMDYKKVLSVIKHLSKAMNAFDKDLDGE